MGDQMEWTLRVSSRATGMGQL
ncbi:hypothetical protein OYC64_017539 [Pagothenia borchgrevinki]|uniref:Uncharacterized protein n=1 Tax=Pagothenia borchgrevinki TaxID=8213 RepID=A0ABD2GKN7_PAGBO